MKAKDILPFGIGFAIGFVAVRLMDKSTISKILGKTTKAAMDVKDAVVDTAKMTACEVKWAESTKMKKFPTGEAYETAKKTFMDNCMSQ